MMKNIFLVLVLVFAVTNSSIYSVGEGVKGISGDGVKGIYLSDEGGNQLTEGVKG